jgi:hypothetical protein
VTKTARRLLAVSLFALASATTTALRADGTSPEHGSNPGAADAALAVELFNAGKALADAGDFAKACPKFADSARRDARVGTLARLAECEEKLGHMVGARLHWGEAKALAQRQNDSRLEHAAREYDRVDALVPKLKLEVVGPPPAGLAIAIDDATVDQVALDVPIPVEAGAHSIRATATNKAPFVVSIVTKSDGSLTPVPLRLEDAPPSSPEPATTETRALPGPTASPTPPTQEGPPPSTWGTQKTSALIAAGLGVAAVGIGSYFGLRAFSKWSDARSECGGGCGPGDAALSAKSDAQTAATISTITFAAGGAALAGAVVLWLTAPKGVGPGSAFRATPIFGANVAGLAVSGSL